MHTQTLLTATTGFIRPEGEAFVIVGTVHDNQFAARETKPIGHDGTFVLVNGNGRPYVVDGDTVITGDGE